MYVDSDTVLIEFLDSLDFLVSPKFVEKWRQIFSARFVRAFQLRILDGIQKSRPIKIISMYRYLTGKCKYSPEQVLHFFELVEIENYYPAIIGTVRELKQELNK